DAGTGADGSCEDVAVVRIGQRKGCDQIFVAGHQAVTHCLVHQGPRARQPLIRQAWVVLEGVANPLLMDRLGPPGPHKPRLSDPDEQVAQRCRVEDVGVVDSGERLLHQSPIPSSWASAVSWSRIFALASSSFRL